MVYGTAGKQSELVDGLAFDSEVPV